METSTGIYHKIYPTIGQSSDAYIICGEKLLWDGSTRKTYFNGSDFGCKYIAKVYTKEDVEKRITSINSQRFFQRNYTKVYEEKLLPMS